MLINVKKKKYSLILFFIIAFLIPVLATIFITLKEDLPSDIVVNQISPLAMVVIMAMIHAPTIAAIIAAFRDDRLKGLKNLFGQLKYWKFASNWYLKALLTFPTIILITLLILSFYSSSFVPVLSISFLVFGSLFSTFWEEVGWTGYATPKMLNRFSPLKVGILLGLIHAIWHLPADYWGASVFYGNLYFIHFAVVAIGIVALRIVTVWIYVRTKSLILGWLTHTGFTGGQLLLVPLDLTSVETIIWQTAFMFSLFLVVIFLVAYSQDLMKKT